MLTKENGKMLEITLELVNKATHEIEDKDIDYSHSQKEAQELCDKRNESIDDDHYWRVGHIYFID